MLLIAGLIIVLSMMASAVLIGGFYAAYQALLGAGYSPKVAAVVIGCVLVSVTALLAAFIVGYIRHLRGISSRMLAEKLPQASGVHELIDAFLGGLMEESATDPEAK